MCRKTQKRKTKTVSSRNDPVEGGRFGLSDLKELTRVRREMSKMEENGPLELTRIPKSMVDIGLLSV